VIQLADPRTLNGDSAKIRAPIHQLTGRSVVLEVFLQPRKVFRCARSIYDQQKFLFPNPINDQVINNAATLVQQKGVLARPDIELVDVICEHGVEPFARAGSLQNQLSHVRNIEDSGMISHGLMFLDDARVLHRHEPPGERNHSGAEPNVFFVKRCLPRLNFAHASKLDCTTSSASVPG
jgi:hypothetical protein